MTIPENFKPLLAVNTDFGKLTYPKFLSPKLDGIRAIVFNGTIYSRNLKPIPNRYIQSVVAEHAEFLEGLDGELIVGDPTYPRCFNISTSGIMTHDGEPDFKFYVFDIVAEGGFGDRFSLDPNFDDIPEFVSVVPQFLIKNLDELNYYEQLFVEQGYEGVMLKDPKGLYKFGRATARSQELLKVKRFEDCELEVVGFEERMHNANEATTNALGHTERSSHKANMIGRGDLGALICKFGSDTVNVGSGFTDEDRFEIWQNRESYLGKLAKIKHQPAGAKDKLRFPVFIGWRNEDDL